jgi:hypothetical protein
MIPSKIFSRRATNDRSAFRARPADRPVIPHRRSRAVNDEFIDETGRPEEMIAEAIDAAEHIVDPLD